MTRAATPELKELHAAVTAFLVAYFKRPGDARVDPRVVSAAVRHLAVNGIDASAVKESEKNLRELHAAIQALPFPGNA